MGARGPKSENQVALEVVKKSRAKPPRHLSKLAKQAWKQIVNTLPAEHFRASDLFLLEAYCEAYATWRDAQIELAKPENKFTVVSHTGFETANPLLNVIKQASSSMAQLSTKLRLAPNARISNSKAGHEEQPVKSKRGRLLLGGKK